MFIYMLRDVRTARKLSAKQLKSDLTPTCGEKINNTFLGKGNDFKRGTATGSK
jgi:hypothetical protein